MDSPTFASTVDSPIMQATYAVQSTDACMRVLIILDITGSMSNEIDAVKQAVAEMVDLCSELQAPSIAFAFITFTEGEDSGCHVSLKETVSPEEARSYINTIQLGRPPDNPSIAASGDDGPENQKAALARTTDLDPSIPTIAFLITDAEPHLANDVGRTARHELNYLTAQRGLHPDIAGDVFKTFRTTALHHFNGNLIINCVVYGGGRSSHRRASRQQPSFTQALYGSFAQQTGGMLMQPSSRQSSVLATGLMDVVKLLLWRMQGAAAREGAAVPEVVDELTGFELIDVSGLNPERASERDEAGDVVYGDNAKIFQIAMERMVAVCGSKWSRRAIGMTAPAEQLQFVWRTARYISLCSKPTAADPDTATKHAAAGELEKLLQLRTSIMEQLPEDKKGHFSISKADVQQLAAEAAAAAAATGDGGGGASVSAISLESVGDALEDDANWEDWLAAVMKLLLGFPMHLQLPVDKFGQPDFMDAWSAVVEELGVDRLASSEFMKLLGDAPTATGPTDRRQHNAFLVVVEPSDKLASLVFRVASGTQALDYVTGVLMGAKGFLPNLHAGTAAACLMRMISQRSALSEFQWDQVVQIAHTLACRHRNAAKGVTQQLLAGQANPEDNISKLALGALRIIRCGGGLPAEAATAEERTRQQQQVLRLVLQELVASMLHRHYGKPTPESDAAYKQSLLQYLPLEALFGSACAAAAATLDPLQQLRPLEQLDATSLAKCQQQQQQLHLLQPDWHAQVMKRLCSGCAVAGVPPHPVVLQFMQRAGRLLAVLLPADGPAAAAAMQAVKSDIWDVNCSSSRELQGAEAAVAYCWPDWQDGLLQALLLRMRTARYRCCSSAGDPMEVDTGAPAAAAAAVGGGSGVEWEPAEVPSSLELVVKRLKEAMAEQLQGYRRARSAEAKQQLVAAAAKALQQHATGSWEQASAALEALQLQLGPAAAGCNGTRRRSCDTADGTTAAAAAAAGTAKGPCASLLGQTVVLQRSDVPLVLEKLAPPAAASAADTAAAAAAAAATVSPSQLHALVLGSWSSQGPQALRRCQPVLMLCQEAGPAGDELLAATRAREVCGRVTGHNRIGHSAGLQYPGPDGWSQDYATGRTAAIAAARTKVGRKRKTDYYLRQMHRFSAMAAWAREAAAGDGAQLAALQCVLGQYNDANRLEQAMVQVEGVLGRSVPASVVA